MKVQDMFAAVENWVFWIIPAAIGILTYVGYVRYDLTPAKMEQGPLRLIQFDETERRRGKIEMNHVQTSEITVTKLFIHPIKVWFAFLYICVLLLTRLLTLCNQSEL